MSDTTPTQPQPDQPRPAPQIAVPQKDVGIAYLWWLFFGALGAHKFYLGRPGWGIAYALTLGLLLVGVIVDLFTLPGQVRRRNAELYQQAVSR